LGSFDDGFMCTRNALQLGSLGTENRYLIGPRIGI